MVHPTDLTHPTDSALLGLVHGQPIVREPAVREHLNGCEPCRTRAADLTERERQIEALLAELDHPMPHRTAPDLVGSTPGRPRRGILAAALATLVAVGAAAATLPASPVHRWMGRLFSPSVPSAPEQGQPAAPTARVTGVVVPVSGGLVVTLQRPQTTGIVEIVLMDRADVAVRSRGGEVAYQVAEARVLIDNRAPAEQYDIEAPLHLERLVVQANSRVAFRKQGDAVYPTSSSAGNRRFRISLAGQSGAP